MEHPGPDQHRQKRTLRLLRTLGATFHRTVAKPVKVKDTVSWSEGEVDRTLEATSTHRWAFASRLGVLYGLCRSEVLAFIETTSTPRSRARESTRASLQSAVAPHGGDAKNERSRHIIPPR